MRVSGGIGRRLRSLEAALAPGGPAGPCPSCGVADPATGALVLGAVVMLQGPPGVYACCCKQCGRTFRAGALERDAEGRMLALDGGPAPFPFLE